MDFSLQLAKRMDDNLRTSFHYMVAIASVRRSSSGKETEPASRVGRIQFNYDKLICPLVPSYAQIQKVNNL
jgi:hypothetical protein